MWKRLVIGLLVIGLLVACLIILPPVVEIGKFIAAIWLVEDLAYDLVPASYPGSVQTDTQTGGGSSIVWERLIYQTDASPDEVLAYYDRETASKSFEVIQNERLKHIYYLADNSPRAVRATCEIASHTPCEDYYPTVEISVFEGDTEGTTIEVLIAWYSP